MADLSIDMLPAATGINDTDLSVLFQSGVTKKVTGTVMIKWLTQIADGHGGIQSIVKQSSAGIKDTYRITLADTTAFDFVVTNGKGITSIAKSASAGLTDTYTITYNDDTTSTFAVNNGAKGDKGDNAYVWIRYASQKPTASSHNFGILPDNWMGIYSGNLAAAPTDYTLYNWFQIKGEKGNTGAPATLENQSVTYQSSTSGTVIPSGEWQNSIPTVTGGSFLWTRITMQYNSGNPIYAYSVSRMGLDGAGAVASVNQIQPDGNGNVTLTADDVGAADAEELAKVKLIANQAKAGASTAQNTAAACQLKTESLTATDEIEDADYFPLYDSSASDGRKTLWSTMVAKIRTALFGTLNGFIKANGVGVISTAAISRADLSSDCFYSPVVTIPTGTNAYALAVSDVGKTIAVPANGSVTFTLSKDNSNQIPTGAEIALCNSSATPAIINLNGGLRLAVAGETSTLLDPAITIASANSLIALKKMDSATWLLAGNAEVST